MKVIKRNNETEDVSFDKVLTRLQKLSDGLAVDAWELAQKVCGRIYDGVSTSELDELAANLCSSMVAEHPDYGTLAARITVSNHHKNTSPSFSETMTILWNHVDEHGTHCPLISEQVYEAVQKHKEKLNSYIDYTRDYDIQYFGFKTLEKGYLMKVNGRIVERPQHMFMRVALGIHGSDVKDALQTYDGMSKKLFVHATPTLFNSGTPRPQMSSCFLGHCPDSIEGIYDTLKECAMISKYAGGIGLHMSSVRAKGSRIRGTNGTSDGLVPMLRVFNNTARYVNQSGRRNGSMAMYLEPWHADIMAFLELKRPHGNEDERAKDLFYAIWTKDIFMRRVKENGKWSLMCPDQCPGLAETWGEEFEALYTKYEAEGRYVKQVNAQEVWFKILESQIETGTPYLVHGDACNRKSNQQNLGTIRSSNLCAEIVEYSDEHETAVCNLASMCLPAYVEQGSAEEGKAASFNFARLHDMVKVVAKNLNKVIDVNWYPHPKTRVSNLRHRPIGVGVQGLADVFALMRMPFDSQQAKELNEAIFETIYHAALESSCELAKKRHLDPEYRASNANEFDPPADSKYPGAYSSFDGCPASKGKLQYDLWELTEKVEGSKRYDWPALKADVMQYGIRNSLLVAPMPTASTSQIMGNTECFEPVTSLIYKRKTLAGEFVVVNEHLVKDLIRLGLWNHDMKNQIIAHDGSIQGVPGIPADIKALYKTVWEISQRVIIDLAADRGKFVCQSQSMNVFMADPTFAKLSSMHFYSWEKSLKCSSYYLRSKAKARTQQFTIDPKLAANNTTGVKQCAQETEDGACLMCSA